MMTRSEEAKLWMSGISVFLLRAKSVEGFVSGNAGLLVRASVRSRFLSHPLLSNYYVAMEESQGVHPQQKFHYDV